MALQSNWFDHVGYVTSSSKVTRVGQFMRLNSSTFIGSKDEEDHQELMDEMEKIF